jgi:hypothetical protein
MPQLQTTQVFMSYSRRDKDVMWRTAIFLREHGINVWVDNEKLIPGTAIWEEEIEKAIKAASTVVVVMSPDSKNSEWVRREITLADQHHKHILPILVNGDEDSSITLRLVTRQYVDMRQNEEAGLNTLFAALSQYLQQLQILPEEMSVEEKVEQRFAENSIQPSEKIRELVIPRETHTITTYINWSAIFWATVGWAIGGAIGGFMYDSFGEIVGGASGGIIGGLVTVFALRGKKVLSNQKNVIWVLLAWTIGGAIGWEVGWGLLTEATGAAIGIVIFVIIGLVSTLGMEYVLSNWKSIASITLLWAIGQVLGWLIARRWMIDSLDIASVNSWPVGTAIGWAIGGFVLSWQILKNPRLIFISS